jgi:hypothetical protein
MEFDKGVGNTTKIKSVIEIYGHRSSVDQTVFFLAIGLTEQKRSTFQKGIGICQSFHS